MRLNYEIGINSAQLRRTLRTVEGELMSLQRRVDAAANAGARRSASRGAKRIAEDGGQSTRASAISAATSRRLAGISAEERARLRMIAKEETARQRAELRQSKLRMRNEYREAQQRIQFEKQANALRAKWRQDSRERWGNVARAGFRGAGTAAALGVGAAGAVGGFAAIGALTNEIDVRKRASMIANQAGDPSRKGEVARAVSVVRGANAETSLKALEEWQTVTGDLDLGLGQLQRLSTIALATGTAMDELAAASGNAFNAIKDEIQDPAKRLEALDAILRSAAAQGQLGAVEIKQMATEMAALAATGSQFGNDRQASVIRAIAMAQVARAKGGAPSAAEAVTATERFNSDITEKQKLLKEKFGVDIWTDSSRTTKKDQDVIVRDILRATQGDQSKLGDIFGAYGIRSMRGFANIYSSAEKRKKGTGLAAVQQEFNKFTGAAATEESLQSRFKSRLDDPDMKIGAAAERFNRAIGERLVPVVTELIPQLEKLIPVAADVATKGAGLVSWMAKNPWEGVGVVAAASIGKSVMDAGIASVLQGPFGKVAGQATALAAAFVAGKALIDLYIGSLEEKARAKTTEEMGALNDRSAAAAAVRGGKDLSTEQRVSLRKDEILKRQEIAQLQGGTTDWLGRKQGPDAQARDRIRELTQEADMASAILQRDAAARSERAAASIENAGKAIEAAAKAMPKPKTTSRGTPLSDR